jgi:RNA polymerase sigma-70 factor (ECF subfamily)
MPRSEPNPPPGIEGAARFRETRWSIVLGAGHPGTPEAREALATLCRIYWYPLYAYVRREGHSASDAQDLTQEFFTRLLDKNYVGAADRTKGKFRSFLLASLRNFLANERRRALAQKRGGGRAVFSLDVSEGETRFAFEPAHELTAEKVYERRWALTLLERTVATLREEFARSDKLPLFEHLKVHLGGEGSDVPYAPIAAALGMTEGAVKVAAHRLRLRCRELLRAEIAQTVAGPDEVDEELRDLFNAVGS